MESTTFKPLVHALLYCRYDVAQFRKSKVTKSILATSYKAAAHYCATSFNSCSGADSQYDQVFPSHPSAHAFPCCSTTHFCWHANGGSFFV